jgi:hypothetical protein
LTDPQHDEAAAQEIADVPRSTPVANGAPSRGDGGSPAGARIEAAGATDIESILAGALGWSTVLALIVSGVVALGAGNGVAFSIIWLAAWGPAAALVGPCAVSLRIVGARARAVATLAVSAIILLGPLSLLGELLKRATHHRPLGAVTFAVLAGCALVVTIGVSYRLSQAAGSAGRWKGVARGALSVTVALGLLFSGGVLLRGLFGEAASSLRNGVLDVALVAFAIAIATWASPRVWARRPALSIGFWGAAIALSALVLTWVPASRAALAQVVPPLLPLAGWLGG